MFGLETTFPASLVPSVNHNLQLRVLRQHERVQLPEPACLAFWLTAEVLDGFSDVHPGLMLNNRGG